MTETAAGDTAPVLPPLGPAQMRWRQLVAVSRLEVRRTLLRGRSLGLYVVALLPVALFVAWALTVTAFGHGPAVGETTVVYAGIYRYLWLALVLFFVCAQVFSGAVRREILERTLHFHFLLPVRREIFLAGKYLGLVLAVGALLGGAVAVTCLLAYLPSGGAAVAGFFLRGPGLGHLLAYVGVTLLAVAGYGALFLALGLYFRRPAAPVLMIFGWEWANFLLPPFLKRFSVSYYLGSLTPVPVPEGPFALLAEAPSPWAAVLGLLVLIAVLLAASLWKLRRTEILYGED